MTNLNITVKNKIATGDGKKIICGNSDYTAVFNFDSEWDAYPTKTMRVEYGNEYTDVVFTGNTAILPVIINVLGVKIGVFAGSLQTTTPAYYDAVKSILCDSGMPVDPTPSVYEQIISELEKQGDLNELETEAKENLVAAINEAYNHGGGGSAEVYMRVSGGYIQYSNDNRNWYNVIAVADLKGDKGNTGADGKSAYEIAVEQGYTGTEIEWLASLHGADGQDGTNGQDGADGITPTIGNNGNWFIGDTDTGKPSRGAAGQDGTDGVDGRDGVNGQDGHTPVKGTDYWTAADQQSIVNDVLEALPTWTGGEF